MEGQHNSYILHHPTEFSQDTTKIKQKHFCEPSCNRDKKRQCWTTFYNKIDSKTVYDSVYYKKTLRFPIPHLDAAALKIKEMNVNGWYEELEPIIDYIYSNRNPNSCLLQRLRQTHTINIGSTTKEDILSITDKIESDLKKDYGIVQFFTLRVFGFSNQDPDFHNCMIPHKLVITDSDDIYIEINLPIRKYSSGSVISYIEYPTELNKLLNLFKPETGLAILLSHNHETEIEACLDAFHSLKNGTNLEFPGYTDVVALWTHLGNYCAKYNLPYMYRLIVGGTLLDDEDIQNSAHWNVEFSFLEEWAKQHILATTKSIALLYLSFIVIIMDRILPDKAFLLDTVRLRCPTALIIRLQGIIGEAMSYVQLDNAEYNNTPPNVRYRCIQPYYPKNQTLISAAWQEYCNIHRSPLFDQIAEFWPWNKPFIFNSNWKPSQLMDTRLIKILVSNSTWFKTDIPIIRDVNTEQETVTNRQAEPLDEHNDTNIETHTQAEPIDEHNDTNIETHTQTTLIDEHNDIDTDNIVNKSLNLITILKALSQVKDQAWKLLEKYLLKHPNVLKKWFRNMTPHGHKIRKTDFLVGNKRNFRALLRIKNKIYKNRN